MIKILNGTITAMGVLAGIVLLLLMMLTVGDVFLRYFFHSPILGTTELTEMMMICICFLGLAYCAKEDAHLKVDILVQHLSRRAQVVGTTPTTATTPSMHQAVHGTAKHQ